MKKICIVSKPPVKNGIDPRSGKAGIDGGYRFPEFLSLFLVTKRKSMKMTKTATRTVVGSNILLLIL